MRTQLLLGVAFAATLLFVSAGCNKGGSSSSGSAEVEVAVFQGGYGIDFFEQAARDYEAAHPGAKVKVWGNPRVWEQLRPRFVAGSPPDVTWPGWGMDYWAMVYDGQLLALDEALSQPPLRARAPGATPSSLNSSSWASTKASNTCFPTTTT